MSLIKCLECGKEYSDKETECPNCGCPITYKRCPSCKQEVEENWQVCAFCGSDLKEDKNDNMTKTTSKQKKTNIKNKWKILFIIVLILLGSVVTYINYTSLNKEEKNIYEIVYKNKNKFKDPSSLQIAEATIYGDKFAVIQIGGNNSWGAFVLDTYYVKNGEIYTEDNNKSIVKEIVLNMFEYERNNTDIVKLTEKSVNKINKKLESR